MLNYPVLNLIEEAKTEATFPPNPKKIDKVPSIKNISKHKPISKTPLHSTKEAYYEVQRT